MTELLTELVVRIRIRNRLCGFVSGIDMRNEVRKWRYKVRIFMRKYGTENDEDREFLYGKFYSLTAITENHTEWN